jgi:hypothetical protein
MKKNKKKRKANTDHIAHQVGVTGTGYHKNKKKTIPRKRKYKDER